MSLKSVLICAPTMPEYDRESGSRRVFHLIEFFREAGWAVSLVVQNETGSERYARMLQQRGVAVYTGSNARTDQLIAAGCFELAILAFWHIAELYLPKIRLLSPTTRVLVDSIDLHFLRNARCLLQPSADDNQPAGLLDPDYSSEMTREVNTYVTADAVMTVSQKEANLINDLANDPTLAYAVPDCEDLSPSPWPFAERKGILFMGNFKHPPNIGAVEYLCQDILSRFDPTLTAEHPVYIVGNALDGTICNYTSEVPHVHMVGWVPSVRPYLERTRISVIPLLYGAGTKRKLIQALMVGTPTVSTSIGIEGLNLVNGEHVLVADDSLTFANSIVQLLNDVELWHQLAHQGRVYIAAMRSREVVRTRLMEVIDIVLAKESKPVALTDGNDKERLRWL